MHCGRAVAAELNWKACASRGLQPAQRRRVVGKGKVPHFDRRKVPAERFRNAGDLTVRHDRFTFDLLVVLGDEVLVRYESREVLPAGKSFRMDQHAMELRVVGEIGIDRRAEAIEVLLAERRARLEPGCLRAS